MISLLERFDPFVTSNDNLCCLVSGLTSTVWEVGDGIKCDTAEEVGAEIQRNDNYIDILDASLRGA